MADSNAPYLQLITSEYSKSEKYNKYVEAFLKKISPLFDVFNSYDELFNLENAQGQQLDIIGSLLGLSRNLPVDNEYIGGTLNDEYFRLVLKSAILKYHWDGSRQGLENILKEVLPNAVFDIIDNQDMSYDVNIISSDFSQEYLALLQLGYILPKPSGVRVNYSVVDKPLFGWDTDSAFIKGWDEATWRTT